MSKTQKNATKDESAAAPFAECPPQNGDGGIADVIEKVLGIIGGKWKVLIVYHLGTTGMCRFGELRKRIPGVTQKMLTAALREMEQDRLVDRKVYAEVPPRVEYRLSEEGRDLKDVYSALAEWGTRHAPLLHTRQEVTADEP